MLILNFFMNLFLWMYTFKIIYHEKNRFFFIVNKCINVNDDDE